MIWVGWINFTYVCIDLGSAKNNKRSQLITTLITIAESIIVALLPLKAVENGSKVYTEGPAVNSVYVFTLLYIFSTLIIAIYIKKKKSARRGFAVIITTSLWILAALIQFLNNELLLVGFSEAIGSMILYIVMENPDANLEKRLGCFNSYAFYEFTKQCFDSNKNYCMLDISITDLRSLEERKFNVSAAMQNVLAHLSSHRDVYVFKNDLASLIVVSDNAPTITDILNELLDIITGYKLYGNEVFIFTLDNALQFESPDELLKFTTYVRSNTSIHLSTIVNISEDIIDNYRSINIIGKEIDQALTEDRVEVFLQPIYSNIEEKVVSSEALVRIRKPDGSLLSPGVFIPIAEITGQVKVLGERVLEKVCAFLKESNAVALGLRSVDINLSAVQCDDNQMAGNLCRIVEKYGIDSSLINFEITETAVSNAKDTLLENMDALVSKGFSFALDDFGKGESNLIYIVTMPVKFIKLDIEMSKAYFENPKAKNVIAAITNMAQNLGLQIVAEGIETQSEAEGISAEGIQYIQGYYYSRPLPFNEFLDYLENSSHNVPDKTIEIAPTNNVIEKKDYDLSALKGQRVLLVEDNELTREIAQELLEEFEFIVDTAEDGTYAVDKMKKASAGYYDFILMDIKMPIMDGFEASRQIRNLKNKTNSRIPIVALTANVNDDTYVQSKNVKIDEVLSKPIDVPKIMEVIARIESERITPYK